MDLVTPNGKEIEIVPQRNSNLYVIQFKSGGQLPKELQSAYTDIPRAKRDVEAYLNKKAANGKSTIK